MIDSDGKVLYCTSDIFIISVQNNKTVDSDGSGMYSSKVISIIISVQNNTVADADGIVLYCPSYLSILIPVQSNNMVD